MAEAMAALHWDPCAACDSTIYHSSSRVLLGGILGGPSGSFNHSKPHGKLNPVPQRRGVFSSSAVAQGCVVEVSPAIVLKKDDVAHSSAGMNYFFQAPDGSELLCVLGFGMMFNHSSGSGANLRYAVRVTPDDVEPPGICVSFEATRDIVAGEELFIDYSSAWWARHKGSPSSADAVGALAEGFANK